MSGNIDTSNNIKNSNGLITSIGDNADDASESSVQNARNSINELTSNVNSESSSGSGFVSGSYTSRGNNRRYSYGDIRQNGAEGGSAVSDGVNSNNFTEGSYTSRANNRRYSYGEIRRNGAEGGSAVSDGVNSDNFVQGSYTSRGNNRRYSYGDIRRNGAEGGSAVSDGVNSDNFVQGSYTSRANNRRYSYGGIRRNGAEGGSAVSDGVNSSGFTSGSYVGRANNRRYSYANIRKDGANESGQVKGKDSYQTNSRYSAGFKKAQARTRGLTAKDNLFQKQSNNRYTYGPFVGGGQQMTRDSALDSLFYSDVANAMVDNGFALSTGQQNRVKNFEHQFSDEFAGFEFVDSDLLYKQAAIVDGLISNGAFLTPEQEAELGIEGGLTNNS